MLECVFDFILELPHIVVFQATDYLGLVLLLDDSVLELGVKVLTLQVKRSRLLSVDLQRLSLQVLRILQVLHQDLLLNAVHGEVLINHFVHMIEVLRSMLDAALLLHEYQGQYSEQLLFISLCAQALELEILIKTALDLLHVPQETALEITHRHALEVTELVTLSFQ